jgi:hypothetical protein
MSVASMLPLSACAPKEERFRLAAAMFPVLRSTQTVISEGTVTL